MDIIETRSGRTGILTLSGRLDTTSAPALPPRAVALCEGGVGALLIDLQRVEFLTSAGFRALIAIRRHAEQVHVEMVLCGMNEVVHDLFEASGLLGSFRVCPDADSAQAALAR
jgi:stage II sporulation protein AA (anti-sigma F factor antagonist)